MNLKEINCKFPKCGSDFKLGDALEEHAIEQVRSEIAALNDDKIQRRIDAEKKQALLYGKQRAQQELLEQVKARQEVLDQKTSELNQLKLKNLESDAQIKQLQNEQNAAIMLKLAEQKAQFEADKIKSETEYKLQVHQLTDDLKRATEHAEQGSMQVQGEASELAIEGTLADLFPGDEVVEVKKGQRGGDCLLIVKNNSGRSVGKILIESKNTKSFSTAWITKLKSDAIDDGAQVPVLVTSAWPSNNDKAHFKDGVWVCGFHEYQVLIRALRQSLIDVARATAAETVREDKAQVMYDFLTSSEFAHTIEQMITPILRMNNQLQKEKRSITRLWKERETLIESSMSGMDSLYMKIQGIAQVNLPPVAGMEAIENLSEEQKQ